MDLKREKNFGIKKGEKSGLKKGEKLGEQKTQIQVVKAMLKENIDIDIISKVTGLTKEEIEKISKNL